MQNANIKIKIDGSQAKAGARVVTGAFSDIKKSARGVTTSVKDTGQEFDSLAKRASGLKTTLLGVAGAMGAGFALNDIRSSIIQYQEIHYALDAASNSSRESSASFEMIKETADKLGLSLKTVGMQYATLAGATKGTAIEGRGAELIFKSVAEASTALHLSTEKTNTVLGAFSKMLASGKVQTEYLRDQIGIAIPQAMQLFADKLGTTKAGLADMMTKGNLMAEDSLPKLAEALHETFGDKALSASGSLLATTHILENRFDALKVSIGENGLTAALTELNKTLSAVMSNTDSLGKALGQGLGAAVKVLSSGIVFLSEHMTLLKNTATGFFLVFSAKKIMALGVAMSAFAKASLAASAATATLSRSAKIAGVAMAGLEGGLAILGGPAGLALLGAYGIYELSKSQRDNNQVTKESAQYLDDLNKSRKESNKLVTKAGQAQELKSLTDERARLIKAKNQLAQEKEQLKKDMKLSINPFGGISDTSLATGTNQTLNQLKSVSAHIKANIIEQSYNMRAIHDLKREMIESETASIEKQKKNQDEQNNLYQKQSKDLEQATNDLRAKIAAYKTGQAELAKVKNIQEANKQLGQVKVDLSDKSSKAESLRRQFSINQQLEAQLKNLNALESKRQAIVKDLLSPEEILQQKRFELTEITAKLNTETNSLTAAEFKHRSEMKLENEELNSKKDAYSGMKRSLRDYRAYLSDTASIVEDSMTSAFHSAEDALTDFVTKGKDGLSSLRDLAQSILADIARAGIQKAIIAPIVGYFGGPAAASAPISGAGAQLASQSLTAPAGIEPIAAPNLMMPGPKQKSNLLPTMHFNTNIALNGPVNSSAAAPKHEEMQELQQQINREVESKVVQILQRQMTPGGLLYRG